MSALPHTPGVAFELDGQPVTAHPGETILKAAQRHGVEIPHLCYTDGLRPDGNCRASVRSPRWHAFPQYLPDTSAYKW